MQGKTLAFPPEVDRCAYTYDAGERARGVSVGSATVCCRPSPSED